MVPQFFFNQKDTAQLREPALYIPQNPVSFFAVASPCLTMLRYFPFLLTVASSTPNLSLPLLCSGSVAPTADSHNVRRRANCSSTPDPSPPHVPVAWKLPRHSSQQLTHPPTPATLSHGQGISATAFNFLPFHSLSSSSCPAVCASSLTS